MNRKRKLQNSGIYKFAGGSSMYQLQDSLNLIYRKAKKKFKRLSAASSESDDSSVESVEVDMESKTPLCNIEDDGLDCCSKDSDSSIEITRDVAGPTSVSGAIIPEILIEKAPKFLPENADLSEHFGSADHLNVKNSTMTQAHEVPGIEKWQNLSSLSPIPNSSKQHYFTLSSNNKQDINNNEENELNDSDVPLSTGQTPLHVKKMLNKMREKNTGSSKDTSDKKLNVISLDFTPRSREPESILSALDISLYAEESSDDQSPPRVSKTSTEKESLKSDHDPKKGAYLHPFAVTSNVTPYWKKSIARPAEKPHKKCFRTSSPSMHASRRGGNPKAKRSLLQLSSINYDQSDDSIELRPCVVPENTVNSDEIVPLSSSTSDEGDAISPYRLPPKDNSCSNVLNQETENKIQEGRLNPERANGSAFAPPQAEMSHENSDSEKFDYLESLPSPVHICIMTNLQPPSPAPFDTLLDFPVLERRNFPNKAGKSAVVD